MTTLLILSACVPENIKDGVIFHLIVSTNSIKYMTPHITAEGLKAKKMNSLIHQPLTK